MSHTGGARQLAQAQAAASRRIGAVDAALRDRGVDVGAEKIKFREVADRGKHRFDLLFDLDQGMNTF
eukprot:1038475-Prorocentrum_minimum.AAC.6